MKQYFNENISLKTQLLQKNIFDFDFQVSASEIDALILEQNLINEYEPKFNIKIKSSKTYPYIKLNTLNKIDLSISYKIRGKDSKYYGPFPDGYSAVKIVSLLKEVFPIDKCLNSKSGKACLNYEMGRCLGFCVKEVTQEEIDEYKKHINDFFIGKTNYVLKLLKEKLDFYNNNLKFEESKRTFENIKLIEKLNTQKQNTFNDSVHRDVINYYIEDDILSISIMFVRFGDVSLTINYISKIYNNDIQDILSSFIFKYYSSHMIPEEIIIPIEIE